MEKIYDNFHEQPKITVAFLSCHISLLYQVNSTEPVFANSLSSHFPCSWLHQHLQQAMWPTVYNHLWWATAVSSRPRWYLLPRCQMPWSLYRRNMSGNPTNEKQLTDDCDAIIHSLSDYRLWQNFVNVTKNIFITGWRWCFVLTGWIITEVADWRSNWCCAHFVKLTTYSIYFTESMHAQMCEVFSKSFYLFYNEHIHRNMWAITSTQPPCLHCSTITDTQNGWYAFKYTFITTQADAYPLHCFSRTKRKGKNSHTHLLR